VAGKAGKKVLDFTNVKDGSIFKAGFVEEDDYVLRIQSVTEETSKNNNDMWVFACELPGTRNVYPYHCTLTAESLWKLRNLFTACGIQVPKKKINVDPNKIVGKEFGAHLVPDEYDGKPRSVIEAVFPASDVAEQEAPKAKSKKKSKPAEPEDVDEEEIEDEDEIEDEVDVEEL
jgi:hypothetical protein